MSKKRGDGDSPYLDPMHSIGYLSRMNFRAFSRALEKLIAKHGVSSGHWRFLRVLWEEDDITQKQLSDRVGIKEPTTVRAIAGLEASGLVIRRPCKQDRRKKNVRLTRKARNLRDKLIPMVVEVNDRALSGLSQKDIRTTRRVLAHTYHNLIDDSQDER